MTLSSLNTLKTLFRLARVLLDILKCIQSCAIKFQYLILLLFDITRGGLLLFDITSWVVKCAKVNFRKSYRKFYTFVFNKLRNLYTNKTVV